MTAVGMTSLSVKFLCHKGVGCEPVAGKAGW